MGPVQGVTTGDPCRATGERERGRERHTPTLGPSSAVKLHFRWPVVLLAGASEVHRLIADLDILAAMRKHTTVDLDRELVRHAAAIPGTSSIVATVNAALAGLVARHEQAGPARHPLPFTSLGRRAAWPFVTSGAVVGRSRRR